MLRGRSPLECRVKGWSESSCCRGRSTLSSCGRWPRWGPQHAYGLAARLEQVAEPSLTLNQGTLYPALVRLEQKGWIKGVWQRTESNREAKYYSITRAGGRALQKQTERWRRLAGLVDKLLLDEA